MCGCASMSLIAESMCHVGGGGALVAIGATEVCSRDGCELWLKRMG